MKNRHQKRICFVKMGLVMVALSVFLIQPSVAGEMKPLADGFPKRAIQLLVHNAPGSGTDSYMRALADSTKGISPVPVVVQNIVNPKGVWGHLDYILAQKGGKDGYYLPSMTSGHVSRAVRLDIRPYNWDSIHGLISTHTLPVALVVMADSPWKTLQDFIDDAKKNPGKLRVVAGGSTGGGDYIVASLLAEAAGIELHLMPSPGAGQATLMLLGGGAEAGSLTLEGPAGYIKAGELRALGMLLPTEARDPLWPDVPSFIEAGVNVGFPYSYGICAPAQVPDSHARWLADLFTRAAKTDRFSKWLEAKGLSLMIRTLNDHKQDLITTYKILDPAMDKLGLKFKPKG